MKTIYNAGTKLLDYRKIEPFQGELKDLSKVNYAKLLDSFQKHDFFVPIFVWKHEDHNYCLDGHGRLRVLNKEKIEFENSKFEVPVYYIPGKDFKQAKRRLLLITSQFQTITQEGIDAYIAEAQLPEAEIYGAVHFDALPMLGQDDEPETEEDEAPEVDEQNPAVSQAGEIYQLGRHRLMCGDSTNPTDVERLMAGQLGNLVFTDPPYMVDYHSTAGYTYKSKKYGGDGSAIFNDDLGDEDASRFYTDVLKNLYDFTTPDAPIYWFYAMKNHHINRAAFINAGYYFSQTIIWVKESMVFSMGVDFHRMFEPIMFGWKKDEQHYQNKRIANLKDTFTLAPADFVGLMDIWLERRDNTASYDHPTQKPVSLSTRALRKHSQKDNNVIDLFGGSGSTLMGCEQLGRTAYLMELDPKFCDVIRKRFHKFHNEDKIDGWELATAPIEFADKTEAKA